MKYKIVSDSSSNVYHFEHTDYACVPLTVRIGNEEYIDVTKCDIDANTEYKRESSKKECNPSV